MWTLNETEEQIDIQPAGEADRHIPFVECECRPRLSMSETRKLMIIHNTFDGCRGFMPTESLLERYSARRAA